MTDSATSAARPAKGLRLWPGVVLVAFQWAAWFGVSLVYPEATPWGVVASILAGMAVVAWWLFFSRAPWLERAGILLLIVAGMLVTRRVVHESIAGGGMGLLLYLYAIPLLSLALVASAVAGDRLSARSRRTVMPAAILLVCGGFTLLRTGGVTGEGDSDFHWRWTPTPEEVLLGQAVDEPAPVPASASSTPEWPGFRGPSRDGVVRRLRLETDWAASPPRQLWRRAVGPGWSSFAVHGERVYTQEQRGDEELVVCYALTTGEPVWKHADSVRFWESNAGAGPRATPTLSGGRVYTMGATGLVNALDAASGASLWVRDVALDTGKKVPDWGFASSPLLVGELAIVAASGQLVAYDAASGATRWSGPSGGYSFSSPHLAAFDGVEQVLLLGAGSATSVAPSDGAVLWQHSWPQGVSIVQPALTGTNDVLIAAAYEMGGVGLLRLAVRLEPEGWRVEERWTSRAFKPYYNDFAVHEGHVYGFDNSILACIDLESGERAWKGGRYGHGQLLLLPEADLLLVLSEDGELALVAASPDDFVELARVPALEGKTWNHPVLVGDVLLIRNAEEMAAFRLSVIR